MKIKMMLAVLGLTALTANTCYSASVFECTVTSFIGSFAQFYLPKVGDVFPIDVSKDTIDQLTSADSMIIFDPTPIYRADEVAAPSIDYSGGGTDGNGLTVSIDLIIHGKNSRLFFERGNQTAVFRFDCEISNSSL